MNENSLYFMAAGAGLLWFVATLSSLSNTSKLSWLGVDVGAFSPSLSETSSSIPFNEVTFVKKMVQIEL